MLTRELTYGELMMLCEGHGASQIYERHLEVVTALRAENAQLKAQSNTYRDKHAYQWHDEAMAYLKAWHEEVDGLKAEIERLTQVIGKQQFSIEHLSEQHTIQANKATDLRAQVEALTKQLRSQNESNDRAAS